MNKHVLVFEERLLERLGSFQGYTLRVDEYLPVILHPANNFFMAREQAEHDPRYKQLIPYVVLRFNDSVFNYVRGKQSGEARLVACRSIGLGGHIEPKDRHLFSSNERLYREAAKREVSEEVQVDSSYVERIVALINDDSNGVGRVHFGIIHIWDLAEPIVSKQERQITKGGFVNIRDLRFAWDQLETWSQIALEVLEHPQISQYSMEVE